MSSSRVQKRPSKSASKRQILLSNIEKFGVSVMPCVYCVEHGLSCKKLADGAKCGECVRRARPCEDFDTDAERKFFLFGVC